MGLWAVIGRAQEVVAVEGEGLDGVFRVVVEFLLVCGFTIRRIMSLLCMNSTKQSRC